MADTTDKGRLIPIDFSEGTEVVPVHSNQVIVQHTEHEFIVTFFEVLPPVINPDSFIQAQGAERIQSVKARPVAKVVMSSDRAREFIAAFVDNLNRFEQDIESEAKAP